MNGHSDGGRLGQYKNAAIEFVKENESGMFTLKRKIGEFGTCFKG